MIKNGSYELSSFSTGVKSEIKRLDSQIDLFWPKERSLYHKWGLKDGCRIIDLGCGTGHLIELLSKEHANLSLTGVEQDPVLVDIARARMQINSSIEMIVASSIEQFNPQYKNFDIAIMRLVLEHVPDPVRVLKHIRSLLKPDGRIIVVDNDFDYHLCTFPDITELKDLYKAYRQSRSNDGGTPCIGRSLPLLLKSAGFNNIDMEIIPAHSTITGDKAFLNAEGAGIPAQLTKSGYLSEDIFNSLIVKWRDTLNSSEHCLYRQLYAATGIVSQIQSNNPEILHSAVCTKSQMNSSTDSLLFLSNLVTNTLGITEDPDDDTPLIDLGLDSVGALDIQTALRESLNIDVSISELLGGSSFAQLCTLVQNRLENNTGLKKDHSKTLSASEESGTI